MEREVAEELRRLHRSHRLEQGQRSSKVNEIHQPQRLADSRSESSCVAAGTAGRCKLQAEFSRLLFQSLSNSFPDRPFFGFMLQKLLPVRELRQLSIVRGAKGLCVHARSVMKVGGVKLVPEYSSTPGVKRTEENPMFKGINEYSSCVTLYKGPGGYTI